MPTQAQILSKGVGIDLGTTNSAVALMNPTDTAILLHRDSVSKSETTPSCVWKDPRSGELIVGRKAFRRIGTKPSPVRSIKRLMGQAAKVRLTDVEMTPEQVSGAILAEMKRQIEQEMTALGNESTTWIVDRAIVTVPAYFDHPQIEATRRAGEEAGLEVLDLLHEPTAAACHYCWRTQTQNGVFLVYDFGGGTFDVSVLRCTAGTFEVLGISGNNGLGGDDLDAAIAQDLRHRLLAEDWALDLDVRDDPEDRLRFEKLRFLAESVKKALTLQSEFLLRDQGTLQDKEGNAVIIETMYDRPEAESIMRPIVERTLPYCQEALERAAKKSGAPAGPDGWEPWQRFLGTVDHVILAGGSTHIPLVRDLVGRTLCAGAESDEPRAKCKEPIYEKVDTVVALGAAIRAAAVGGLAVYNPERSVRVSFRGTGATGARSTHIGGRVEALRPEIELGGGRVRLLSEAVDDEADIKEGGAFAFRQIPLQAGAENLLTFEVYDQAGSLVATAGRPISQDRQAGGRPTGGASSTAVLARPVLLEVTRAGKPFMKELFPATQPLPASQDYEFTHPGDTELLILPMFWHRKKLRDIHVQVHSSLPKGTPIKLNVFIDPLYLITVKGAIGDAGEGNDKNTFEASLEPPPPREPPTAEQVAALEGELREALAYLPAGKRNVAQVKWNRSKSALEGAQERGEKEQAVHEFDEMEEIVGSIARTESVLQPPKEDFDKLVTQCTELNGYATQVAADKGKPHDGPEIEKAIEVQREQGESAWNDADQQAYGEAIGMLEGIRNHLGQLLQTAASGEDSRSEAERAADAIKQVREEARKVENMAKAKQRPDFEEEAGRIGTQLDGLAGEVQSNPRGALEKAMQLNARLEQMRNVLMEVGGPGGAKKLEDHT